MAKAATRSGGVKDESMLQFYKQCAASKTIPYPIFAGITNGVLSLVGQHVSEGMASALAALLRERSKVARTIAQHTISQVTLEDNGLRDDSIAMLLEVLLLYPTLRSFEYSNNDFGPRSVALLGQLVRGSQSMKAFRELQLTSLRCPKTVLIQLLK